MERKITITATIIGILSIILGAFGAHALKKILTVEQISTFETGVKYQMYHALFLLYLGLSSISEKAKKIIYNLVVFGILFFSGSIYLLATKNFTHLDFKLIGILTPIGGLLFILAWIVLMINYIKKKS